MMMMMTAASAIFSPTSNLPNFVVNGEAPHLPVQSPKRKMKENVDWLTKIRKQKLMTTINSQLNDKLGGGAAAAAENLSAATSTADYSNDICMSPRMQSLRACSPARTPGGGGGSSSSSSMPKRRSSRSGSHHSDAGGGGSGSPSSRRRNSETTILRFFTVKSSSSNSTAAAAATDIRQNLATVSSSSTVAAATTSTAISD